MKILKFFGALLLMTSFISFSNAQDNNESQRYYIMDYMKVHAGMHDDYIEVEKVWKKVHQANIKAGKYSYWSVEEIISDYGTSMPYNYITRRNFDNLDQLVKMLDNEVSFMPDNLSEILTSKEMEIFQTTGEVRDFVKTEVWRAEDIVMDPDRPKQAVVVFNYFNFPETGSRADHMEVEKKYWKPAHTARIEAKEMKGWVLLSKVMPGGGSQEPYYDATVDVYDSMRQYMSAGGSPVPMLKKTFPNKNLQDIFDETSAASDLIKSEIRRNILSSDQ